MERFISAEKFEANLIKLPLDMRGVVRDLIAEEPTADVRENIHAHWEGDGQCSNCKDYPLARYMRNPNFCPNCGAQMDEEELETTEEDWYKDEWRDEWDERREDG